MKKLTLSLAMILASCVSAPPTTTPSQARSEPLVLQWETNHPERAAWTKSLQSLLTAHLESFDKAKDIGVFCPKYGKLNAADRVHVLAVLIEWLAYYESGWNQAASSVDVGEPGNKDTYSAGLLQMSVVDQKNYGLKTNYNYAQLLTAAPNLDLGITIMAKQIDKRGVILIPKGSPGVYWATLCPNGKYDKTSQIAAKVKALELCK